MHRFIHKPTSVPDQSQGPPLQPGPSEMLAGSQGGLGSQGSHSTMGKRAYYRLWAWTAFRRSLSVADAFAGVLGLVLPPIPKLLQLPDDWGRSIAELAWQLPIGVLVAFFVVRLLLAPYWIHQQESQRIAQAQFERNQAREAVSQLKAELHAIQEARPRLKVVRCVVNQAEIKQLVNPGVVVAEPFFASVMFINEPDVSAVGSNADVIAEVAFFNEAKDQKIVEFIGRWGDYREPPTRPLFDSPSNYQRMVFRVGDRRTLNLALKHQTAASAFAFNDESYQEGNTWDLPDYKLTDHITHICVRLRGIGVDKVYWFTLTNHGIGQGMELHEAPIL